MDGHEYESGLIAGVLMTNGPIRIPDLMTLVVRLGGSSSKAREAYWEMQTKQVIRRSPDGIVSLAEEASR